MSERKVGTLRSWNERGFGVVRVGPESSLERYFLHVNQIRSGTATPSPGSIVHFEVSDKPIRKEGDLPAAVRADIIMNKSEIVVIDAGTFDPEVKSLSTSPNKPNGSTPEFFNTDTYPYFDISDQKTWPRFDTETSRITKHSPRVLADLAATVNGAVAVEPANGHADVALAPQTPNTVSGEAFDEKAEPTYLTEARKMAARGVPVFFIPSGEKGSDHQPSWQNICTTDPVKIRQMAAEHPTWTNYGCVGKSAVGIPFPLDDDAGVIADYEKLHGPLPATLKAQSCNGGFHYYLLHSAKSVAYHESAGKDRIQEKNPGGKGELWSLRMHNSYVIGPGSVAKRKDGKLGEYKIVHEAPIAEIPDSLLDFLTARYDKAQSRDKQIEAANPDAPHTEGSRNNWLATIAGSMRGIGSDYDEILARLRRENDHRCSPSLPDSEVEKIAESISKYDAGMPGMALFNGKVSKGLLPTPTPEPSAPNKLKTKRANEVKTKKISWLWDYRIPFGKLSVLAGNPDQGKSLVTMYAVCQLTNGLPLFGSSNALPACDVLVLAGEDEADDTIVPRLQAGAANLSRVHIVESVAVIDGKGLTVSEREAQLDTDIQAIETMLQEHPQIRLVIVDPLSNYLGRANMNREQEVRAVLVPLKNLAARTGVAITAVMHLNKNGDASAIHRIGGAVAFSGVARAAWLFTEDPEDAGNHLMLRIKGNIAKRVGGLVYRIQAKPVEVQGSLEPQPYVEWIGETEQSANDVLVAGQPGAGRPPEEMASAEKWLAEYLSNGSEMASDVRRFGSKAGHSYRTLVRAKAKLNVQSIKVGQKSWEWSLPLPESAEPKETVQ